MDYLEDFVHGICMEMCPQAERELREAEGLIHPLEATEGDFNRVKSQASLLRSRTSGGRPTKPRYSGNPSLVVKCYQRSAAGLRLNAPENLRPAPVLISTVQHLLNKVVPSGRVPWCEVHGFVSDRLRSVRQDATIQQIDVPSRVTILESCARFYAYSMYRQCNEHKASGPPCIDRYLNQKQLEETLHSCIALYDETTQSNQDSIPPCRLEIECLNLMVNIDSYAAQQRALTLRKYPCIKSTLQICLYFALHNYSQLFKSLPRIPPLSAAVFASLHLAHFIKRCLGILNAGFSCRNNYLPLSYLQRSLCLATEDQVKYLCDYYGLRVDAENHRVACVRAEFQASKTTEAETFSSLQFIDTELLLVKLLSDLKISNPSS